jgi:hypothetical protein
MNKKNFRLPLYDQRDQLLEQLETELAVGWNNVSRPLDNRQLSLKKAVQLIQEVMEEEERKRDYL